jgi:hypothetical protein
MNGCHGRDYCYSMTIWVPSTALFGLPGTPTAPNACACVCIILLFQVRLARDWALVPGNGL